jgi:hypothetical protein
MNTAFSRDLDGIFLENIRNRLKSKSTKIKTVMMAVLIKESIRTRSMPNIKMA